MAAAQTVAAATTTAATRAVEAATRATVVAVMVAHVKAELEKEKMMQLYAREMEATGDSAASAEAQKALQEALLASQQPLLTAVTVVAGKEAEASKDRARGLALVHARLVFFTQQCATAAGPVTMHDAPLDADDTRMMIAAMEDYLALYAVEAAMGVSQKIMWLVMLARLGDVPALHVVKLVGAIASPDQKINMRKAHYFVRCVAIASGTRTS